MSKAFKSVSIRVPAELHERATAKCRKQKRSFNDAAINALQCWVDEGADLGQGGMAMPGATLMSMDFSALEDRIMARFDKLEKVNDIYAIQALEVNTDAMTPEQIQKFKDSLTEGFQRGNELFTVSGRRIWGGLCNFDGFSSAPASGGDIYAAAAKTILEKGESQ